MNLSPARTDRVLAIDPTCQGFGFAVFEGPEKLIDWGRKQVRKDRNRICVRKAADLIARLKPEVLVVEHTSAQGCRRRARVRRLIRSLLALARRQGLRARQVSRRSVLRCFFESRSANKYQVAAALAERFPELAPHLPPERKLGDSEDERMAIFDALAFGWTFYKPLHKESRALASLSTGTTLPHA